MTTELKCPHCGSQEDVVIRSRYIGGQGYVPVVTCRDETRCAFRWDEQNDMVGFNLEGK